MNVKKILDTLLENIEKDKYKGWDIFDGLNSRVFKSTPFYKSKLLRLIWIQIFKRSPINFRKLTMVPKGYNSKGLALFIQGLVNLYNTEKRAKYLDKAYQLAEIIISQKPNDRDYFCVGYNFFWEARAFSVPAFTPNVIVSSFVGQAFLDLYRLDNNSKWLNLAKDIAKFIELELILYKSKDTIFFGYIPGEDVKVHNANLMGARLYARLYYITDNPQYKNYALKSARYSVEAQRNDGAWYYGEEDHHRWIDNFHTGFNLVSINDIQKHLGINYWDKNLEDGLKYHIENHYLDDMTPKYYNNKLYPIDIHNFAQGLDTLLTFGYLQDAKKLLYKSLDFMWDNNKSYFYYQKNKYYTNKINYIRWSQAWMFFALSKYLNK